MITNSGRKKKTKYKNLPKKNKLNKNDIISTKKLKNKKNPKKFYLLRINPVTSTWWSRLVLVRSNGCSRKLRTGEFNAGKKNSDFFPLTESSTWSHDVIACRMSQCCLFEKKTHFFLRFQGDCAICFAMKVGVYHVGKREGFFPPLDIFSPT